MFSGRSTAQCGKTLREAYEEDNNSSRTQTLASVS